MQRPQRPRFCKGVSSSRLRVPVPAQITSPICWQSRPLLRESPHPGSPAPRQSVLRPSSPPPHPLATPTNSFPPSPFQVPVNPNLALHLGLSSLPPSFSDRSESPSRVAPATHRDCQQQQLWTEGWGAPEAGGARGRHGGAGGQVTGRAPGRAGGRLGGRNASDPGGSRNAGRGTQSLDTRGFLLG